MKLKTKLTLGIGLLFLLIILLGIVGTRYSIVWKKDTGNILADNYKTLEYTRNMLAALEEPSQEAIQLFETTLQKQENNITETGEQEATRKLREIFDLYKFGKGDSLTEVNMRMEIFKIMDMNMQAIQHKSKVAKNTADSAIFWIVLSGALCLLIAFFLLIKLPPGIFKPIEKLTQSIRQIAEGNYSERLSFDGHNEFGQLAGSFNGMAEKLEEYNNSNLAKLMIEKKRIEALINNMNDPVIGLDESLNVIFVNKQAVKIMSLTGDEMLGRNSRELALKNDLIKTLIQDLTGVTPEYAPKLKPMKIFTGHKEGYFEKETLHIAVTPTGEHTERLIGHVIILRNVTEYKELDFAKTNFIATVSHEFKTPISSIKLSVQLLENERNGQLNDGQKELIESIKEDTNRLLKITGELLKMTQVESGNIQLTILPTDPKEVLFYAIKTTKTQADQRQINFETECAGDLPLVYADAEKIAWVLTNIIANAVRYSYDNSTIYISVKEIGRQVEFSVRDSGQGIATEYRDKIFDRYFRVPGTRKAGTGLGLAISKEFIEAQGGHISVNSELGAGSTFKVTLNSVT